MRWDDATVYDLFPDIDAHRKPEHFPDIRDPVFWELFHRCKPYTLVNVERLYGLFRTMQYVAKNEIPGDYVECGVLFGGSVLLAALTAARYGGPTRFHLYDTFEGFPAGIVEKDIRGNDTQFYKHPCFLATAKKTLSVPEVAKLAFRFVEGPVEETLKGELPQSLSVLRLDTDYYGSTLAELRALYPRLSVGGVLILDDYGCFEGARTATEEYLTELTHPPLLHRTDTAGRSAIKLA